MSDKLKLDSSLGQHLFREMLRIRRFEAKCVELYQAQKIRGFLHLYDGEEAIAVGVMQALDERDAVVATYRDHGHAIAKGIGMGPIMAEMFGKLEGCSRGRGGSMHVFDRTTRFLGGNAIVGGGLPLAVGTALADAQLRPGAVTACFFGEGAAGEGEFHESMNLAALWQLPVLFVCENNLYALADNKLALNAGWDQELLALELQELIDLDFEVDLTGFSLAEIDLTLDAAREASTKGDDGRGDVIPHLADLPVCRAGEIWELGRHRLLCGDARSPEHYGMLMNGEPANIVFTDPPYNVPIDGHVSGLGQVRHREFAMASGEMSVGQFTDFLACCLGNMARHCHAGTILYVCMDWRHMRELCEAGDMIGLELKNLVVWNKTNGGMGSFYRSKHELIFVFKHGDAPHVNSFGLGDTGRYRTNVWDYPGISSISASRDTELAMHPTVKPVALVADALRDCSRRGDIVLDPFGGSGTTLIAAQQTGRIARLIEFDPLYCDTIIRRFEQVTGKRACLAGTGEYFEEIEQLRAIGGGEPA